MPTTANANVRFVPLADMATPRTVGLKKNLKRGRLFLWGLARLVVKMNSASERSAFCPTPRMASAAVLGANDGIISTASLIVGVASASADAESILVAGVAGLVGGAMSMAAGEYVSVSSQSDTERADLAREKQELKRDPASETEELARIYVRRGLELPLARQVARQLMAECLRSPCSQRAWALGHKHGTPCPGRNGFGGKFFCRRCGAARFGSFFAIELASAVGVRVLPALFGGSRDHWRPCRWGWHPKAHNKRDVLGCTCDGSDGRDRRGFRHSRLGHAP